MRRIVAVLAAATLVVGVLLTQSGSKTKLLPLVDRARFGAYVHLLDRPHSDPVALEDLTQMERRIGKLDIIHYFVTWGRGFDEFVTPTLDNHEMMLSLKPDGDLIRQINTGVQDGYVDSFASRAASFGKPVYLRFGHEMNGSWMSYSSGANGGPSAEAFVQAWRHLVDRFRIAGATNVKFVWSPNESDEPAIDGNRLEDYWPGASYVDIAGFDAYNWTDAEPRRGDAKNRSFDEVVHEPYDRITKLAPDKELWLCEVGTVEPGKADWFRGMFASRSFPKLTAVIYFSENDQRDTQRDWRIDTSEDAVQAWREALGGRSVPAANTAPVRSR